MYNTSNPAEIYSGTTWELLPNDKFIKTGATPLQQNGNNSVSISKVNLPAEKLQIDSFQLGRGTQEITGAFDPGAHFPKTEGAFSHYSNNSEERGGNSYGNRVEFKASRTWSGMSTSASPYTVAMGNGTPLTINPEHITIKAWKRLS